MSLERNDDNALIGAAGYIFQTPVRAKKHKNTKPPDGPVSAFAKARRTKAARRLLVAAIAGTVARKPEVMVKVSGAAKGKKHLREHMAYITRNGKLMAEVSDATNEDRYLVSGSEDVRELAAEWFARGGSDRKANARDTINIVLSMPAGIDREGLAKAAAEFARSEFGGRFDYVLVHHADTDHPHAHLTVRTRNDQGQYLDPRKADLQLWREKFAAALRRQGIDAAASPRRARGVVQKSTRQAVKHLNKRQAARTSRWKIEQAVRTIQGRSGKAPDEPWTRAIADRQRKIRAAWGLVAQVLEGQGEVGLSVQVRAFIAEMPPLTTKNEKMVQAIQGDPALLARTQKALQAALDQGSEQTRNKRR